jgi:hypothetical protein
MERWSFGTRVCNISCIRLDHQEDTSHFRYKYLSSYIYRHIISLFWEPNWTQKYSLPLRLDFLTFGLQFVCQCLYVHVFLNTLVYFNCIFQPYSSDYEQLSCILVQRFYLCLRPTYLSRYLLDFSTFSTCFFFNLHSGGWNQGPLDTAAT